MTDLDVRHPSAWAPPAEPPLWSSGPGSLDETGQMAVAQVVAADRTEVFAVPPELLPPPAPAPAPVDRSGDRWWGPAIWAGVAAAFVLVVVAWVGLEGRAPVEEPTTGTGEVRAADEGSADPFVEPSTPVAPTTPSTVAEATTVPSPEQADPLGDPFPPGFPLQDGGPGQGHGPKGER